ncbi:MAG TPA: PEGA domain-containing protein [Polyangiaceae bacterium]|nr:PEGA domain-containing protein [Polyangiaceae bacterium]
MPFVPRRLGQWSRVVLLALPCSIAAVGTWATPARAQAAQAQDEQTLARARAHFQRAIELEQAGNWAEALRAFREVGQVRMTPQVRFHIALCEERLGRLVAALGGYELALADADSVGPDFRAEVTERVEKLRARIPHISIQRGSGAEAATIRLDGVTLGSTSIGVQVPLDPGPHVVMAEAPGYERFETTVTLEEGATQAVDVVLTPLPEPPPAFVLPPYAEPSRPPVAAYVIGGVGVASLVTSGVFFLLRENALEELEPACPGGTCPPDDKSLRDTNDRMRFFHYGSQVALGVGIAAVGTSVVLLLANQRTVERPPARVSVTPALGVGTAGANVQLTF